MKKWIIVLLLFFSVTLPASAAELVPPEAPDGAADLLPEDRDSFAEGLWYVIKSAVAILQPDVAQAGGICFGVIGATMLISILENYEGKCKAMVTLSGVVAIGCMLFRPAHLMINLGSETVAQLSDYGKLLLPVMTAALAAQGGTSTSAAWYVATAGFDAVLSSAVTALLVPCVYVFLAISVADAASENGMLKKIREFISWAVTWGMKIVLYLFFGFMSVSGVISGTADQTAVKAAKMTISGMVPVIGSMLSDASEAVVLGAGVVKNTVGVYGLLALIAIMAGPFLRIGLQYLLLKFTAAICSMYAGKQISGLIGSFASAMGLMLAMTGTVCMILLISVVCFMKGMG